MLKLLDGFSARKGTSLLAGNLPILTVSLVYLVCISIAEIVGALFNQGAGIALQMTILFALLIHSTLQKDTPLGRMLLSLTLAPMIRIASYTVPLVATRPFTSYVLIYVPIGMAAFMVMGRLKLKASDVGLNLRNPRLIPIIAGTGFAFGFMEYFILRYPPLISELTWTNVWLPGLGLMATTGFVEEFIFRGVMQQATAQALGKWHLVYVSFLFAIIHVIHHSFWDIILVFLIALFFAWCAKKTGSLAGVILGHGITNSILFLVAPFVFKALGIQL